MTRSSATTRPALATLMLAAIVVAAIVASTPGHAHSTVGAEAACATCTLQHQPPSLETPAVAVSRPDGIVTDVRRPVAPRATTGFGNPSQPRSPPFSS